MSEPLKFTNDLVWTEERCDELESLQSLFNELNTLNRGSGFIERAQRCIDLAAKLNDRNYDLTSTPFMRFVLNLAIEDRKKCLIKETPNE